MSNTRPTRTPDKPAGVSLNLDTLTREVDFAPFVFIVEGDKFELADPGEMDYQELAASLHDPRQIFQLAMSEKEYTRFLSLRIPVWKMQRLAESYMQHYGFDPMMAAGNVAASPS